ncbi:uncharacterized protein [Gossypium hirsutum]|uniref:Gag-pro-like protein n=1 Tax=Gossypium hirsutum TaxID=3635 RepID=A0ABM3AZM7_GOSHI|nr:uncharacterized protein LOC107911195 [Gossypium hirsutum]
MTGEVIENAVRSGKIDTGENFKRLASRKKEGEVNNVNTYNKGYSKSITVCSPKTVATSHQSPQRQETNSRIERPQFTPIPITYRELYQNLFDAHVVSPFYLKPMQPPFPKWYDTNAQYEYHAGITGHSIENGTAFKKVVERLIKMGVVKLDDPSGPNVAGNPLPDHVDKGVNVIAESGSKRIKIDVMKAGTYCEFHAKEGHNIQECAEFKTMVQNLMDNKVTEFYKEFKGIEEREVYASEEGPVERFQKVNHPVVIISRPRSNEAGIQIPPKVIIQKSIPFSYKDNKKVPWNYDCNVTVLGERNQINALEESKYDGFYTRSGKRYDPIISKTEPVKGKALVVEQKKEKVVQLESPVNEPVTENEAREFLKFLKHSEYSFVEQLHKQPARISVLALLLSSEAHHSVLMKVLNETYVANDISVNKLDRLVGNISADNFIFFSDDEIPLGGIGSTKALHITTHCKGYMLPGVLIDNGSALNVLPLSTLNRLPVDSSHMKTCQNIMRAFDGTERRVMGRIEIPHLIGPSMYDVGFLVMDIKHSYNCLLGRPWIHSAGAVPSSLHQKLKR